MRPSICNYDLGRRRKDRDRDSQSVTIAIWYSGDLERGRKSKERCAFTYCLFLFYSKYVLNWSITNSNLSPVKSSALIAAAGQRFFINLNEEKEEEVETVAVWPLACTRSINQSIVDVFAAVVLGWKSARFYLKDWQQCVWFCAVSFPLPNCILHSHKLTTFSSLIYFRSVFLFGQYNTLCLPACLLVVVVAFQQQHQRKVK